MCSRFAMDRVLEPEPPGARAKPEPRHFGPATAPAPAKSYHRNTVRKLCGVIFFQFALKRTSCKVSFPKSHRDLLHICKCLLCPIAKKKIVLNFGKASKLGKTVFDLVKGKTFLLSFSSFLI